MLSRRWVRWSDVDLKHCKLTIRRSVEIIDGERRENAPKTRRSAHTLTLAPFVVAAFRQQPRKQVERRMFFGLGRDEDAYVFDARMRSRGDPIRFRGCSPISCAVQRDRRFGYTICGTRMRRSRSQPEPT